MSEIHTMSEVRDLDPTEMADVEGGISEWDAMALYRQSLLNHGYFYLVQAPPPGN
jgi:hypothetical protein